MELALDPAAAPGQQDLTLDTTLAHLCAFLSRSLGAHYPEPTLAALHARIVHHLRPRLAPTWDPLNPSAGCGTRSLIAMPGRFPTPLVQAALDVGVDPVVWARAMSDSGEWQLWVDPGSICWRDGGWVWVEEGYERERMYKQTLHTIWQTPLVPSTADDVAPPTADSSSRSVSSPFPMAANSATAALQKHQQRQQHPTLDTQSPAQAQALRAPAVFRIPVAPFPFLPPPPPVKQLGSLSLRDGNDAPVVGRPGQRAASVGRPALETTTVEPPPSRSGVIGMGFASTSGFVGSGLLEGSAPLVKRGTTNRNSSLPSATGGLALKRSPLTPTTTVSVTTSNNIPPPPFGSGIPGQPGSGVVTPAPLPGGITYSPHGYTAPPVKRHHLKNWTEAEPNRLVARSKARLAKGGEKARTKDEATRATSVPAATHVTTTANPTKSGTYPALGRRPSPALLNVPSSTSADTHEQAAAGRHFSMSSSCASGAEADTEREERDTSLDESDSVPEPATGSAVSSFAKHSKVLIADATGKGRNEVERKGSPGLVDKKKEGDRSHDSSRVRIPSQTNSEKRSISPIANVGNPVKLATAVPDVPQSVQGYDGGNVGVLGGGVKLGGGGGGGAVSGGSNIPTTIGKPDHVSRSVSGQSSSTGRATTKMRSTVAGSGAFAASATTGSESEATIGSGTEGGKATPGGGGGGNKKRRGRPQQSRSPNIPHSHSHDPAVTPSHTMHTTHHWSPVTPTHMHHPSTTGGMPGMLGGGIAGQPGSIGFPPGSTLGWQGYVGAIPSWAARPPGGLGLMAHSPPYMPAASSVGGNKQTSTSAPIKGPAAAPALPTSYPDNPSQVPHWVP